MYYLRRNYFQEIVTVNLRFLNPLESPLCLNFIYSLVTTITKISRISLSENNQSIILSALRILRNLYVNWSKSFDVKAGSGLEV